MGQHKTTHICDKKCTSTLFYTARCDFSQKCITHCKTFMKMNEFKKIKLDFLKSILRYTLTPAGSGAWLFCIHLEVRLPYILYFSPLILWVTFVVGPQLPFVKLNHFREVFLSPRHDFHVWGVRKDALRAQSGSGRWFLSEHHRLCLRPLGAIGCRI